MFQRHPSESPAYVKIRDELLEAEIALRDQRERVAELRRSLPRDTPTEDEVFEEIVEGERRAVRLSELFRDPDKPLVLMHFMYGKAQTQPCPMCTLFADGYDGAIPHLEQRANFAVLVAGDVGDFAEYAATRGWANLRLVSAKDSSVKRDLGFETPEGGQIPGVSVYERRAEGGVVHFYSQSAFVPDRGFRMMDLLSPVWHFLDLTPDGRGDFMPSTSYPA